jgi:hypothetical protein
MPVEIERTFLVVSDAWRQSVAGQRFCQGYLAGGYDVTVRIRRAGPKAYVTIKGKAIGPARPEYEYEIPVDEAEELLQGLCRRPRHAFAATATGCRQAKALRLSCQEPIPDARCQGRVDHTAQQPAPRREAPDFAQAVSRRAAANGLGVTSP